VSLPRKPRTKRRPQWAALAKRYLKGKCCAVCGGSDKVVPHHIIPVHVDATKELDETNLIPLCEGRGTLNCHLWAGHLGNWCRYNATVISDASYFSAKIKGDS